METKTYWWKLKGTTLIESLVVLSVLAILLNIALFEYTPLLAKNRLENKMQEIRRALGISRHNAQTNDAFITFCALKDNHCNKDYWHKSLTVFVDNNEIGAALLRIIEVIGPDKIENIDEDTVYFIINTLNQLNVDLIRNKLLLKVLPLKV